MKKNELESIMKLFGDTGADLALFLGIARSTFSAKINETNGAEFTQNEIMLIKQRYQLTPEQLNSIFFTAEVS